MNHISKPVVASAAFALAAIALFAAAHAFAGVLGPTHTQEAQQASANTAPVSSSATTASTLPGVGKFGEIKLDADSFTMTSNAIVYHNAHMVAQNGATLDADEIRANLVGGKIDSAVATGNVHAHVSDINQKQTYTVTADKAVFTAAANNIDLTGDVRATIESPATEGPIVQTADKGIVTLGKAPDYPRLDMSGHVHVIFTPTQ